MNYHFKIKIFDSPITSTRADSARCPAFLGSMATTAGCPSGVRIIPPPRLCTRARPDISAVNGLPTEGRIQKYQVMLLCLHVFVNMFLVPNPLWHAGCPSVFISGGFLFQPIEYPMLSATSSNPCPFLMHCEFKSFWMFKQLLPTLSSLGHAFPIPLILDPLVSFHAGCFYSSQMAAFASCTFQA